jgi:hypothetical protein
MASEEERLDMASEEAEAPKRVTGAKRPETRCNPGVPTQLIAKFPSRMRELIKDLELSKMVMEDMKLTALHYRQTYVELLESCVVHEDSNQIELKIKDDKSASINPKVVQHVLDLAQGTDKDFKATDACVAAEEYEKMVSAVRRAFVKYLEKDREKGHLMTPRKLMMPKNIGLLFEHCDDDAIRPYAETEMLVRLYFAAVHDRMLLPGTTSYVTKSTVENVYHLEKLCELNWAHLVFNALKKDCLAKDKAYMRCCVVVLLVSTTSCCK